MKWSKRVAESVDLDALWFTKVQMYRVAYWSVRAFPILQRDRERDIQLTQKFS